MGADRKTVAPDATYHPAVNLGFEPSALGYKVSSQNNDFWLGYNGIGSASSPSLVRYADDATNGVGGCEATSSPSISVRRLDALLLVRAPRRAWRPKPRDRLLSPPSTTCVEQGEHPVSAGARA